MMDELFSFPNTEEALKQYADFIVNAYKDNLERDGHKASGQLISSIHSVVVVDGQKMAVDLYLEDYWKWVEKGRLAGKMPPMQKILDWIRVKPVLPRPDANGKVPTEKQLAYLIARKIGNEGIPAGNELMDAKTQTDDFYWSMVEEAITKDLNSRFTSIMSMLIV